MNLGAVAAQLRVGQPVTFKATGGSMRPRIQNGEIVTVAPLLWGVLPEKGQVVLAKVNGRWYLHLVTATKPGQVQISNNHGRVNGWTSLDNVVGVLNR